MVESTIPPTLITGGDGRLAQSFPHGIKLGKKQLDITKLSSIKSALIKYKPKVVIHTAAITDVDYCENYPQETYLTNTTSTYHIAGICNSINAILIFISTAAVFNHPTPNKTTTPTNPINIYGTSKAQAEEHVRDICPNSMIIRTGWLFGQSKQNKFVETIIDHLLSGKVEIPVLLQTGCPTWSSDLASAITRLIIKPKPGIYHLVNRGIASREDIINQLISLTRTNAHPYQVSPSHFNLKALRPINEVLSPTAPYMRPWKQALREYVISII